jgi:hypothetical protein
MDSGTILIASFMIFSMGRTTVSGLNFEPKTGEVEERWGDPTAAGQDGQERGRG